MINRLLIVGLIVGGLGIVHGRWLGAGEAGGPRDPVDMLLSPDHEVRSTAQARILAEREVLIAGLIAIIDDPDNHVRRHDLVREAMETLGRLRAVEGIDILTQYIGFPFVKHPDAGDYPSPYVSMGRLGRPAEEMYPATSALIAIGEASIPKVVAKLASADHLMEQRACIVVLRGVGERATVRESLEAALAEAAEERRPQLKRALDEVTGTD